MRPVCSACASPKRAEIDAALQSGESVRTVGELYGLSKSSVYRHVTHLGRRVPPDPATPVPPTPEQARPGTDPAPEPADAAEDDEEGGEVGEVRPRGGLVHGVLSPKQKQVVSLLSSGMTQRQAAQESGVSERAISNWIHLPRFQAALGAAMERSRKRLENRLYALGEEATVVVQRALRSKDEGRQLVGARMALGAATRAMNKYRELQVAGYVPPPMFIMPPGTHISTVRTVHGPACACSACRPGSGIQPQLGPIIEAEGHEVE